MSGNIQQSIFSRIFEEELEPILFQDENWFVILANRPINEGHLLIIPRQQSPHFYEIPTIDRGFNLATQFAQLLQSVYKPPLVSLFVKGFSIEQHAHIHLIPLFKREEMDIPIEDMRTIGIDEMKAVAEKIMIVMEKQPIV